MSSMVSPELLRRHWAYTAWASSRLVEAAKELTQEELRRGFQTADRSVLGTLLHFFRSDRLWLARMERVTTLPSITGEELPLETLKTEWSAVHNRWRQFLAQVADTDQLVT